MGAERAGGKLPQEFLIGAATAAHQIEGGNIHNDWYAWEERNGRLKSGEACRSWERWKEDIGLLKKLGCTAYRMSVEGSRIEPAPGVFDEKAIGHYSEILKELRKTGIEPVVALHHFTNPLWFVETGGWENSENISYFEQYVQKCVSVFGEDVKYWITVNEPNVMVHKGYLAREWPPGKFDPLAAIKVYQNLALAHRRAYEIIHKTDAGAMVGCTISMTDYRGETKIENGLASLMKKIANYSFWDSLEGKFDFLAINYYFSQTMRELLTGKFGGRLPVSDFGWPIDPEGIYNVVKEAWERYGKPVFITENGIADAKDAKRIDFVRDHLRWLLKAIKEGIPVLGYLYWSLLDNFEWAEGYGKHFGLYTRNRKARPSARVFAEIARSKRLD